MEFLKTFSIALVVFLGIDIIWLSLIAKKLYDRFLKDFLGKLKWVPAILFYLLFVAGLAYFVILPSLDKSSWTHAFFGGIFFGLVTYATYDLTNLATLKNWPAKITVIDLAWGSFLGGFVSILSFLIMR